MKDILFATEFSDHSPQIFQVALALANAFGARLCLLHVMGAAHDPENDLGFDERIAGAENKVRLFDLNNRPQKYGHIQCEHQVEIGFSSTGILKVAEERAVDLIVIGTQGQTNAIEHYFGDVASTIIEKSSCPVLLVPPQFHFKGFDQISCATDFKFCDLVVLNACCKWANHLKAKLSCVHVLQGDESLYVTKSKIDVLKEVYSNKAGIQFHIRSGDLIPTIEAFVKEQGAEILALAHHHHSLIARLKERSITHGIAREIPVPLLIFNVP